MMDDLCEYIRGTRQNSSTGITGSSTGVVHLTEDEQKERLQNKRYECLCDMYYAPNEITGVHCNRTWDNIMCWDDAPAGTTVYQRCPPYINNFHTHYYASRICLPNGTWEGNPDVNGSFIKGWTNYTVCHFNGTNTGLADIQSEDVPHIFREHLPKLRLMYNVGYALSLASLIVAFCIMIYFRKLHCSRNTIHLHLFSSFIFRAAISLIRDNFMVAGIGFPMDVSYNDTGGIVVFRDGPHWQCRLFFALFQYTIAASHVWIFIEAVYLHMLIFVSVFTESVRARWFILFGWLFPMTFVLAWCICRHYLDNSLCWNTHSNRPVLVWILKMPIMVTIVFNFFFFINIIRVLYTKLKSPQCPDTKKNRYRRLARSTLFLVPTFGVYYVIFTIPTAKFDDTVEFVMLFIEMFFNSFQGFFIALVLCFINAEVRMQMHRHLANSDWCPCIKPGPSTKTDYMRNSITRADISPRRQGDVEEIPLRSFHGNNNQSGHCTRDGDQDPFVHKPDNDRFTNGAFNEQ